MDGARSTIYTVNDVAKAAGIVPHVVRYYSRIGLLHPARDPQNGYKLFAPGDAKRLAFIRQAQSLGFALGEIAQILGDSGQGKTPCPRVREILQRRIRENREKLEELNRLQARMENALRQWQTMPDRLPCGDSVCHLIEATADSS